MLEPDKTRCGRAAGTTSPPGNRAGGLYDQYAAGLYQQALFALDDAGLAEQVVCDVLAGECARVPGLGDGEADASHRLAVAAYRRCQELDREPHRDARRGVQQSAGSVAGRMDPSGLLSGKERGALGLVLFGGLGYVQAGRELTMTPPDMAMLLRTVLHKLASTSRAPLPSAASAE